MNLTWLSIKIYWQYKWNTDLSYSTILDHYGTSTVNIQTTGHKKTNFTIILECIANSTKLLAICIFKLKNIPRELFS